MKKKRAADNVKLGIFVTAGAVFLVFSLYMIGKNRNMFGSTFSIYAHFRNINGLVAGNNVRFSGIDVGTVQSISVDTDTSVVVEMIIDSQMRMRIKKNAIASIGTDGLVGNKIINISSSKAPSSPVDDGDVIVSRIPVESDEMLRTLQSTNNNISVITTNLREVSERLNGSTSLWNILSDTLIVKDLQEAADQVTRAGKNARIATAQASVVINRFSNGNGLANTIFMDTALSSSLQKSVTNIQATSEGVKTAAAELEITVSSLRAGNGAIGKLLADSLMSEKIQRSITNIEEGTGKFNENMEALKRNFLFRKYYRKKKIN